MIWENGHWRDGSLNNYITNGVKTWVYEVVRVEKSYPVFISEHLNRLWQGAKNIHVPLLFTQSDLITGIFDLVSHEKTKSGNIRIQVDQKSGFTMMGFIPHHYPSPANYQNGIQVALLQTERTKPNVKSWNPNVRKSADQYMHQTGSYEAILVNQEGYMTEGSRSNLFGVQNGTLITPPLEQVLPGITRQVIIKLAFENSLPLKEARIHKSELDQFEAFFISGTSPGILPVRKIEAINYSPRNSIIEKLSALYKKAIEIDIDQTAKNIWNNQ
ncbi:MAG: aminotransferase class IV family protein [Bacteroidales bacterium]|nr:aminotransferase class IV family protein [Bacteroidales bacterium]